MERPPSLPVYMEIANLEHRLAALRDKQQSFARHSDLAKRVTWVAIPAVAVLVACIAFATQKDPGPMLAFFSILISAWATAAWIYRDSDWSVDLNHFYSRNRYTSYRVFLEESIQECEKALAQLKAKS
jgi:hypothetical protein